jgi:hypothetical protein
MTALLPFKLAAWLWRTAVFTALTDSWVYFTTLPVAFETQASPFAVTTRL